MIKTPLFNHYGVFVRYNGEDLVIHKNSTRKERITTLEEFMHGYDLRGVKNTPMVDKSATEILFQFEEMTDREFNLFTDNCEKFAAQVSGMRYKGREVDRGVYLTIAVVVAILLIRD